MGNFVNESAFIENKVQDYLNQVSDQSIFMEGNFTPVTYYSKCEEASTSDIGLGNVVELVGSESPIKFYKIENTPLYNFDTTQLSYDYDEEEGLDSPVDSSANMPSGIIKPKPDDYFVVPSINKEYLFRVTNIEGNSIRGSFIYRIEFELSSSNVHILEERQVTESYIVEYDTRSPNKLVMLQTKVYGEIEELNEMIHKLRKNYATDFYHTKLNRFISKNHIYDNNLMEFIYQTSLFVERKTFRENIYVQRAFDLDDSFYYTPYYALIEDYNYEVYNDLAPIVSHVSIQKEMLDTNIFSRMYTEFEKTIWSKEEVPELLKQLGGYIDYSKLYSDISLYDYNNVTEAFEFLGVCDKEYDWVSKVFILHYINIEHHESDKSKLMRDIIHANLHKTRFTDDAYLIVPCVLYILLTMRNKLLNLTSDL